MIRVKARYLGVTRRVSVPHGTYESVRMAVLSLFGLPPLPATTAPTMCLSNKAGDSLRPILEDDDLFAAVAAAAAFSPHGVLYITLMPSPEHPLLENVCACNGTDANLDNISSADSPLTVKISAQAALAGLFARKGHPPRFALPRRPSANRAARLTSKKELVVDECVIADGINPLHSAVEKPSRRAAFNEKCHDSPQDHACAIVVAESEADVAAAVLQQLIMAAIGGFARPNRFVK